MFDLLRFSNWAKLVAVVGPNVRRDARINAVKPKMPTM